MSKMGETTEKILEIVNRSGKLPLNELEKMVPFTDKTLLDFMREAGFITIEKKEIEITEFGQEILKVNSYTR